MRELTMQEMEQVSGGICPQTTSFAAEGRHMGEILEWVRYVLERWMLYLMFSTSLFPLKVWDIHTNRYQGFSRPETRFLFILLIPVGGWFAWVRGETRGEIFVTVMVGCLMMYLIPQLYAEIKHKRMHGVWLSQTPGGRGKPASGQDENDKEGSG